MFNLASPRPVRMARQTKIMHFELFIGLCAFTMGCIISWNTWQQHQPMPSLPPLAKAPQLTVQPLHQHFKIWQLMHQNLPPSLQIVQLEYANQQWVVHLLTKNLTQLYEWQEKLLQKQQLKIELQQSETSNQGFRIRLRVSLL